jgi:Domain of unknown function (DUF1844)
LAEHKHDDSFKVIDRRPFTAEGELRKEAVEEERREQESAKILSDEEKSKSQPAHERAQGKEQPAPAASAAVEAPASDGIAPSRQFQMLVDFLARNAAAMLGGMTDPRTGQAFLDLEGAREMIDLLDVLREKTRGNLAAEDDSLLVEVIGSLKLSFMEISNAAAARAKSGAKP